MMLKKEISQLLVESDFDQTMTGADQTSPQSYHSFGQTQDSNIGVAKPQTMECLQQQ